MTRRPNHQLSFSFGLHICLGLHIARLQMRQLFDEFVARIGTLELAGPPKFKMGNFVTGMKSLPIRFTAA